MEYNKGILLEADVLQNPMEQFRFWFEEAFSVDPNYSNAMVLSSVDRNNRPSARVVLLKESNDIGFVFYTNYQSRKGEDLSNNPNVSLTFFWQGLERQVRIEGVIEKTSSKDSEEYFASRPFESQVGAWASNQSEVVNGREILDARFEEMKEMFSESVVPKPENWGGYLVKPDSIEFWQGRPNRMNDRLLYRKNEDLSWKIERLAP